MDSIDNVDKQMKAAGGKPRSHRSPTMGGSAWKLEQVALRDIYEVGDKLGEGEFGVVHEVFDRTSGSSFAVKMVDLAITDAVDVMTEVEVLKRVMHESLTVGLVALFQD